MHRLLVIFATTVFMIGGVVAYLCSASKPDEIASPIPVSREASPHSEDERSEQVESPPVSPERVSVNDSVAEELRALKSALAERDATIEQLNAVIAQHEVTIALLKREETDRLVSEFRKFAEAEGVTPEVTNILADLVIPQLGEVPSKWELSELAPVAQEIFPKIDESQEHYTGDMDDPEQRALSLKRREFFRQWNLHAERILGPERAKKVKWGS